MARRGDRRVLLGYADEDGTLPVAPVAPFERNGTFVVYRKLAMDVAAFRRYVASAGYPGGPERLAAKIVGRWPDGTPLTLSPDGPDAAIAGDSQRINEFSYADDADGFKCPLGAHIRRANPRDSPGSSTGACPTGTGSSVAAAPTVRRCAPGVPRTTAWIAG